MAPVRTDRDEIYAISRPSPRLLTQYLLTSLLTGPGFPIVFAVLYIRYRTLRYRFDDEGISWSRGVLFRREIHLTYSRIQDIHLASNVLERYLGLARIQIQTASGKAGAEMTIEGLEEHELVRDFIYSRMRGLRPSLRSPVAPVEATVSPSENRLVEALTEVSTALRELREMVETQRHGGGGTT